MNLATLLALSKNRAARWVAAVVFAGACLWVSRCQGARAAHASDAIDAADASAKASAHLTDTLNKVRAAATKEMLESFARQEAARVADSIARRGADCVAYRLAVVGAARAPVGTITLISRSDSSAPGPGPGAADGPPAPDTTRYVAIQRLGDPRLYTVPQFTVDGWNDQRKALAAAIARADAADAATHAALLVIAIDSAGIRSRDSTIAARTLGEAVAKSSAGRDCELLPFVACPPRKLVFFVTLVGAGFGGAVLDHQLNHK